MYIDTFLKFDRSRWSMYEVNHSSIVCQQNDEETGE